MKCPCCDEHFELNDYYDENPFQCDHCNQWLNLDLDESTYEGAVKRTLIVQGKEDLT